MYDLILYDTSNFEDFPIGGQLTSIRHFLKYLARFQPEAVGRVLLVGITTEPEQVGKIHRVRLDGCDFAFLPVLYRERELANVRSSLRAAYLKALLQHRNGIPRGRKVLHYFHTPEAYLAVKLLRPMAATAVFSHGSFLQMADNFRFCRDNALVKGLFHGFVIWLLKTADRIFVLDRQTEALYRRYTNKLSLAENSVVIPDAIPGRNQTHTPIRVLFAGRLSAVKGVDTIIDAVAAGEGRMTLTVVGDGEERGNLTRHIQSRGAEAWVTVMGSVPPEKMAEIFPEQDILVMNSTAEGKPMTILEAMGYGLPLVSTPVGGIPEMVVPGKSAEFTDGTAEDILRKVEQVAENYAAYRREARENVKKYDYRTVNAAIWQQLTEL